MLYQQVKGDAIHLMQCDVRIYRFFMFEFYKSLINGWHGVQCRHSRNIALCSLIMVKGGFRNRYYLLEFAIYSRNRDSREKKKKPNSPPRIENEEKKRAQPSVVD